MRKHHAESTEVTQHQQAYLTLCEQENIPIFMQGWWIEGVCAGKDWDVIFVLNEAGETVAAMPFEYGQVWWKRYICQPELTPYGGVWLRDDVRQQPQEVARICQEVDQRMRDLHVSTYNQRFGVGSPMPNAMKEEGYTVVSRITYTIPSDRSLEDTVSAFSKNKRNKLEQLTQSYRVEELDPEDFFRFHRATCSQKKQRISYTRESLLVIWEKATQHDQCAMFGVRNEHNDLLAAAFMLWDQRKAYLLMNTFDHDYPDNGARERLTLEVIKRAKEKGLELDFAYHRPYLRHYGAKKQTYYSVYKGTRVTTWLRRLSEWWQA